MRPRSGLTTRRFPEELKEAAVERFLTSDLSLTAVAEQFGTTRYSIANWVQVAQSRGDMGKKSKVPAQPATPTDARGAAEKLRLIVAAGALNDEQLGEFLRREGLHEEDLERYRVEAMGGLDGKVHNAQDRRQIQELERTNAKQAKRLREAEVLLELQKKVQELWGAKEDDTTKS